MEELFRDLVRRGNALTQEFAALRDDAPECERRSAKQLALDT